MLHRCTELLLLVSQALELIPHSFSPKCSHKRYGVGYLTILEYTSRGEVHNVSIYRSIASLYSLNFSRPDPKRLTQAPRLDLKRLRLPRGSLIQVLLSLLGSRRWPHQMRQRVNPDWKDDDWGH